MQLFDNVCNARHKRPRRGRDPCLPEILKLANYKRKLAENARNMSCLSKILRPFHINVIRTFEDHLREHAV